MTWEKVTVNTSNPQRGIPMIRFGLSGRIFFNWPFVKKYNIKENRWIQIFYDEENNRVGFRFFADPQESCRNLYLIGTERPAAQISIAKFIRKISKKVTFDFPYLPKLEDGMVIINLDNQSEPLKEIKPAKDLEIT